MNIVDYIALGLGAISIAYLGYYIVVCKIEEKNDRDLFR